MQMKRWADLEAEAPQIAEGGRKLVYQYGVGLGFLATLRKDGGLRLHPFCPVITGGGIYGLIGPSPKRADLVQRRQFAIHANQPEDRDDEFMLAGSAVRVTDAALAQEVQRVYLEGGATSSEDEWTFEFLLDRALLSLYKPRSSGEPTWPPQYFRWQAK
jgi:hypothetical protein